jgi:hypothetical protein
MPLISKLLADSPNISNIYGPTVQARHINSKITYVFYNKHTLKTGIRIQIYKNLRTFKNIRQSLDASLNTRQHL